ncbi:DUF6883 domain-containing protein [Candidatus Viridilinea mediisalina]|uniref:DUF6883 domain-containing protein n=1 Tax=Candidatus Viridilinea mediisalina TaxID=2024553 RepID=A0A2A6RE53_9CHLR|nr:DUF6883 domain-containing protein [Candidatus Viridilinea mediisalina]PDW01167.1 hypothetical protein CJ255_19600 [Candidatus Viridilinea mediisalina]
MRLPYADQAIVEIAKLRDYCLNPAHPRGRHKARVFAAALGLTANDAAVLRDALLHAAQTEEATVAEQDAFGQRYVVDFRMYAAQGEVVVRSSWIVRTGEQNPRLTSCYVL